MSEKYDKQITNRLKRSEGQMRGVLNMIEEERDCKDIIMQLSAIRSGVDKAMALVATNNLSTCLSGIEENHVDQDKIQEALDLMMKSR